MSMNNPSAGGQMKFGTSVNGASLGPQFELGSTMELEGGITGAAMWQGQVFEFPETKTDPLPMISSAIEKKFNLGQVWAGKFGGVKVQTLSVGTGKGANQIKTVF